MDESHNIVLPYSWPTYSEMGGEPVQGSPAIKESEYCHALIHRYFTHFLKIFTIFKKGILGGGVGAMHSLLLSTEIKKGLRSMHLHFDNQSLITLHSSV